MLLTLLWVSPVEAQSTLSEDFARLQSEAGRRLSYGRDASEWTDDQTADVGDVLRTAQRWIIFNDAAHTWSWLRPIKTLDLVDGTEDYTLDGDFGGLVSETIAVDSEPFVANARVVPEYQIRRSRANSDITGPPLSVAVRPKNSTGQSSPQRWELMVWPMPDRAYTLSFQYRVLPAALTVEKSFLLGGAPMAELYVQAVRAACERFETDRPGDEYAVFLGMLKPAIEADGRAYDPDVYGYNADRPTMLGRRLRASDFSDPILLMNGVPI